MTGFGACPVCDTPRPANRNNDGVWCCSIGCYRAFHGTDRFDTPSRDEVTTTCPGCQHPFSPVGLQPFCCEACRVAVYRRGRETTVGPVVALRHVPRQPLAVYACDRCGTRALAEQRCEECRNPMRRVGLGGFCPCCTEPVAVEELLGQEVIA